MVFTETTRQRVQFLNQLPWELKLKIRKFYHNALAELYATDYKVYIIYYIYTNNF